MRPTTALVAITLATSLVGACADKAEPESPLVAGKPDPAATDFVLAGELAPGDLLHGTLTPTERYLGYTFYGRAGDAVEVDLTGCHNKIDTVLWVYGPYQPEAGGWGARPLGVGDDHAGSPLSTVSTTLPGDGQYLAIVSTYEQRDPGQFEIALHCAACSTAPRPGDLAISEIHARPAGDARDGDANGDGVASPDGDEFVELRNMSRVPVSIARVELWSGTRELHAIHTTQLLAPGQAFVMLGAAPPPDATFPARFEVPAHGLGLPDDGATLSLVHAGVTLDSVAYPASSDAGSLVRFTDESGTSIVVSHLALTAGMRALSPGTDLDGSLFANPNTSTRITLAARLDTVEPARAAAEAAVSARFGRTIPVTISRLVFLGPALTDDEIVGGLQRFAAHVGELANPAPDVTRITFASGNAAKYGSSAYLDVDDDGRQAFSVLSATPASEPGYQAFLAEADARFAAELPLLHAIDQRVRAWLPTPTASIASALAGSGTTVTSSTTTTTRYGSMNEYHQDTITANLSTHFPSTIRVYIYYGANSNAVSSISVSYTESTLPLLFTTVRSMSLDATRKISSAQNYIYDQPTKRLLYRDFLDGDGNVERKVDVNPALLPRESITADTSDPLDPVYADLAQRTPGHGQTTVGIFDSGVDYNHPALISRFLYNDAEGFTADGLDGDGNGKVDDFVGWDFDDEDRLPYDYYDYLLNLSQSFDHGTHVSGIASQGSPDIKLMPARWKTTGAALAAAVDYMGARGVRVINMSFGSTSRYTMDPLGAKITARPDLLFVAAAGNDGADLEVKPQYPASYTADNLIVVAAVDDKGALTSWSNFGAVSCDLAAPGDAITSTVVGGGYGVKSGTSMSTPYVVNIAAKMLALAPALSPKQAKAIVMTTVNVRTDFAGKMVSQGVIDGPRAMRAAWLWQRVKAGASATAAANELGLSPAETARLVAVVAAVPM